MLFLGGQILSATVLMKRMNWPLVKISRLAHGHHRIDFYVYSYKMPESFDRRNCFTSKKNWMFYSNGLIFRL